MPEPKPLKTIFTYPWDLADEGPAAALDVIEGAAHLNGVSLALAYHVATYFLPHNPRRNVYFGEDGMVLFAPDEVLWKDVKIRPKVSEVVEGKDWLAKVVAPIKKRSLHLTAWTVYFYNHHLARTYPECAKRDALGNAHGAQLCPAHPDVRRYALVLTEDIARNVKPDAFYLESLSFLPFSYGLRNPKIVTPISPRAEFLLGLCFCDHCVKAASKGLDAAKLRGHVATWLERTLPRMPTPEDMAPADDEWSDGAFESRLQHYMAARSETASSLYEEVAAKAREHGVALIESDLATDSGLKRSGLLPTRVNKVNDRVGVGVPMTADEVAAKRKGLTEGKRLLANLQPSHAATEEGIVKAVGAAKAAGVDGYTFYNYGLLRSEQLRGIGAACAAV